MTDALEQAASAFLQGDLAATQRLLDEALDAGADPAEVHYRMGLVHNALGASEEAADSFGLATHFRPDFAAAWRELAALRLREARFDEAHEALESALESEPDVPAALNNLALALRGLGRFAEAAAALRKAMELEPGNSTAHANLGLALKDLGDVEGAIAQLESALHLHPQDHQTGLNLALLRLAAGDFGPATWRDYEKRWLHADALRRRFDFPEWDGTALAGKTLLVYSEQGLGDEIMFASCIPDVLAKGGKYVLECSPKLTALFQRSFPQARVIAAYADQQPDWRERLAEVDCQIAIGSLPRALGFGAASFPRPTGYLRPDPARVAHWKSKLPPRPTLNIGVSWRGGVERTLRGLRSVPIGELGPLWRLQGCHFVSLQYGDVAQDLAAVKHEFGVDVEHPASVGTDLDEAAALICALDAVVSVATAVVHLTGALGRTAWVMVAFAPEWRYGMRGERMPWYPSVRLFRQAKPVEWQPVVESIVGEVQALRPRIGAR